MVNMAAKQLVSPTKAEVANESAEARFLSGKLAMWPQGSWMIKDLNLKARNFAVFRIAGAGLFLYASYSIIGNYAARDSAILG